MSSISGSETEHSDTTEDDMSTLVSELKETNLDEDESSERQNKNSEPILRLICPNLFPITINLGIYKNVLDHFGDTNKAIDDIHKLQVKPNEEPNPRLWTMFMVMGGHFAALVLDITENIKVNRPEEVKVITHKTFHRYTSETLIYSFCYKSCIYIQYSIPSIK